MRALTIVLTAALLAPAGACTSPPKPVEVRRIVATPTHTTPPTPSHRAPAPTPIVTERPVTHPQVARSDGELVQMSWYDQGSGTASGEALVPSGLTCAGASRFPMLSHWRLTNPRTGASTVIKVNDRGAFEGWGRSFDCVPGVWAVLGFDLGAGVVSVEASAA